MFWVVVSTVSLKQLIPRNYSTETGVETGKRVHCEHHLPLLGNSTSSHVPMYSVHQLGGVWFRENRAGG